MCVNFIPVPKRTFSEFFKTLPPNDDWAGEVWEDYAAPIIVSDERSRKALLANFGFLPKKKLPPSKRYNTMNARAETIGIKQSFQDAWHQHQFCLVPMMGFYEPYYEFGSQKAERYLISLVNDEPFAVAGIWRSWNEVDGSLTYSFTQITINANDHPLMNRMHQPGKEKRGLVIVPESDYDAWLECKDAEIARTFLQHLPAELMRAVPMSLSKPAQPATNSLF
ncbi:MAG: SOS response-associated peptidase family protein [Formivibrio sp.]|nr:SOS response-associated peptidase family protein [Formivibrio sp.]